MASYEGLRGFLEGRIGEFDRVAWASMGWAAALVGGLLAGPALTLAPRAAARPARRLGAVAAADKAPADVEKLPDTLESGGAPVPLAEANNATAAGREPVGVGVFGEPIFAEDLEPAVVAPLPEEEEAEEPPPAVRFADADILGSEWKIGILWNDRSKLDVTWVRCKEAKEVQWGFRAKGKWTLEDGLFLTFSRDFFGGWHGKRLFSGKLTDDGNFIQGVVRGWKPWDTASVMGKFQAIRLGVERPNPAPWLSEGTDLDPSGDKGQR